MTLKYVVNGDSTEDMKVAAVVSDQLRAAGFNVDVQPLTGSTLPDTIRRGDYDIAMNAFCPGYIAENLELFHSKNYVPLGQPAPWFERNSFRYSNPELDVHRRQDAADGAIGRGHHEGRCTTMRWPSGCATCPSCR